MVCATYRGYRTIYPPPPMFWDTICTSKLFWEILAFGGNYFHQMLFQPAREARRQNLQYYLDEILFQPAREARREKIPNNFNRRNC